MERVSGAGASYAGVALLLFAACGGESEPAPTTPAPTPTPTTPAPTPPPPEPAPLPAPANCDDGFGFVENLRMEDRGSDWVTYAWDPNPCVDEYEFQIQKVYSSTKDFGDPWCDADWCWGYAREQVVREPKATFFGLTDGVYGARVYRNSSDDNPYVLYSRLDRPYFDYSIRFERWEDSRAFFCTSDFGDEARRTGSVLLREWDQNDREPFTVNVNREVDRSGTFDADFVLAEAGEAVERFEDVLGFRLLELGTIVSRNDRREREVLISYGQYPDQSEWWAGEVIAFALAGEGRVTMTGRKPSYLGGYDEFDLNRRMFDLTLIHEIFHLFGFLHADISLGINVVNTPGPGVDMTHEMTQPSVDTLRDFAALRCVLDH